MSVALLDVNALIALMWAEHPFHRSCSAWFAEASAIGWATCPITEAGFVRVLCNPTFTAHPPSVSAAIRILQSAAASETRHSFWSDDLPVSTLASHGETQLGPKQITDAYLLSLAIHKKGKLATFDRRIQALAPVGSAAHQALLILRP